MGTAQQALAKAAGEIGYYAPADPEPGSKYGRWLAEKLNQPWLAGPSTSIWWCVIFQSWVLDGIAAVPGLPNFNTDRLLAAARPSGAVLTDPHSAIPGDLAIFDWDRGTAATNHIALIEINAGTHLQTIEGNTSGTDGAHQSDGNGVWRRARSWDSVVAVIRPTYDIDVTPASQPVVVTSVTAPAPAPALSEEINVSALPVITKGAAGVPVRRLQGLLIANGYFVGRAGIDGSWGSATDDGFFSFQRVNPDTGTDGKPDGVCGAKSWSHLIGL